MGVGANNTCMFELSQRCSLKYACVCLGYFGGALQLNSVSTCKDVAKDDCKKNMRGEANAKYLHTYSKF